MSDQILETLKSIDGTLKALLVLAQKTAPKGKCGDIADDRELDSQYGDPEVKFDPRDWKGPSYKGRTMSQCPSEYLEMLAGAFDYFASKAEEENEMTKSGKPVAQYKRKDAARARGWALRNKGKSMAPPAGSEPWGDPTEDWK